MTEDWRPDWLEADLRGEQRNLRWYLDKALAGDQQAARRALRWMADSLSPAALAQNGGTVSPTAAAALQETLRHAATSGDAPLLRAARVRPAGRGVDHEQNRRLWWACVEIHSMLAREPGLSQEEAASRVVDDPESLVKMEPNSLAKVYRRLEPAIEAWVREGSEY
ncbi:hypothetical protein [Methylibium petroleiphilum]|uniref:hypothetical protein n=1 Tax=Methylibium petroleiphilum TaxID=105560 RepID=UPI003D2BF87C